MAQDAALLGGGDEFLRAFEHGVEALHQGGTGFRRDVFIWEVDEGFDVGEHGDDLLLHGGGFATDGSAELLVGGPEGKGALRVNQVHDGLGLGEVHFAIKEGPLGEFAGFCRARTAGEETIQNALGDEHAAVTVELDDVLARVAGRCFEVQQQAVIERISSAIDNWNEMRQTRGEFGGKFESLGGDGQRLRTGNADDADGGLAKGGGNGGDGVCEHRRW